MMKRIRTTEIHLYEGQQIQLQGWLHATRRLGGINFIILRDGWGLIQAITEDEVDLMPLQEKGLQAETVLSLTGLVVKEAQAPGGFEIHQPHLEIITPVTETLPLPLHKKEIKTGLATLLNHSVVVNRHPTRQAIFRLAANVMAGFRQTLTAAQFTEIQTPKIVASATESGANVFQLDYFGRPAYLAQSPQFYKQIMVGVFERVFEVGPVFRAEPHDTTRHINEYVSLDVEFGFIQNHFCVMDMVHQVITGIFAHLASHSQPDLQQLNVTLPAIPPKIPHIHFSDAQKLIFNLHGVDVRGEPDLSPQDERWLGEWAKTTHQSDFLFVIGYPMSKRPFYTHPDPTRPQYSNSFDLLFRGVELITGGQRLHHYTDYQKALTQANLSEAPFESYLEAFRYGMPPHGGFAIGLERLIMQLLGTPNLRLTTLFPRDMQRLTP